MTSREPVATLFVPTSTVKPAAGAPTPPPIPLAVTFYRVQGNPRILEFGPSGLELLATISEKLWTQPSGWPNNQVQSFYYLDSNGVRWGASNGDFAQSPVQIAPPPPTTTEPPTSTSSIVASNTSTQGPAIASATSGTTSSTGAPSSVNSNSSSDSAAIAGAAVGCLIAGALIASLIFWFCWGKRKSSRVRDFEASSTALMPHEKGFATNAIPLGSSPVAGALPLPLEDKAITSDISKISNSIKNHVQSYYQMGRVSPGLIDVDDILALGSNQPIPSGTLSTMLDNSKTREIALRFCIAWVVCSRMQSGSDPRTSLLPAELAGCFQKMSNGHRGSPGKTPPELARWRVTTAELMQGSYIRDPFSASDGRNASIQAAVSTLENILQPFADSRMDNGERRRNLEEILKRSALSAFTLFSQPSTWDFDWREAQSVKNGELCIFPALVQLTDETGQSVNPPRPFSEAVVRRLNE